MTLPLNLSKQALRHFYRERCRAVLAINREAAGVAAATLLVTCDWFQQAKSIACYLPLRDEFDSEPCIKEIWSAGKDCYLPVIAPTKQKQLHFVRYQQNSTMKANRYGILEPDINEQTIALQALEVIIMPLLAFDRSGVRLGTGGGYYDQTLALSSATKRPLLVGLAYSLQEAKTLPRDAWDILMDEVLTEESRIIC